MHDAEARREPRGSAFRGGTWNERGRRHFLRVGSAKGLADLHWGGVSEAGDGDAELVVGDFSVKGFVEGFEAIRAVLLGGGADAGEQVVVDPGGGVGDAVGGDEFGQIFGDGRAGAGDGLADLVDGLALLKEIEGAALCGVHRGTGGGRALLLALCGYQFHVHWH